MAFEISQFSNKGLELLGQLSSHKSLVVKNILAAEKAYTAADFEQNIAWWTQETAATMAKVNASLSSAGHDKDQARLTIKFTAKPGQQNNIGIKTVIVIACGKESGVETEDIVYCGVSDPQGITVLGYKEGGVDVSTAVSLYFKFNAASSITLETNENPDFVLHSEMDRFLSCHKVGDVTVGEDQEVRGSKYFQNGIMLNGQEGRSCIEFTDVYGRDDVACTVNIDAQERGLRIVSGNHLFNDTDRIFSMELDNGTGLFDITRQRASYHVPDLYVDNVTTNSIAVEAGEDITLKANITPLNNNVSVGTTAKPFNNIYATNLNATNVDASFIAASGGFNTTRSFEASTSNISTATTEGVALMPKGLRASKQVGGSSPLYSNLYADSTGFKFCINTNDAANYSMSISETAVTTDKKLFINNGAELAKDQVLKLNGKVNCNVDLTDQVMLAVPDINKKTPVASEEQTYIADIPVGGIALLFGQMGAIKNKRWGIAPGEHFSPNPAYMAMTIGVASQTDIINMTWFGNHAKCEAGMGIKKLYAPDGEYVALSGAITDNPADWVTILAMRIS